MVFALAIIVVNVVNVVVRLINVWINLILIIIIHHVLLHHLTTYDYCNVQFKSLLTMVSASLVES